MDSQGDAQALSTITSARKSGSNRLWTIPLRVHSDASQINQLHHDALTALQEDVDIHLDWSEVRHLHASALQILIALRADLAAQGRTWKVLDAERAPEECALLCRLLEAA